MRREMVVIETPKWSMKKMDLQPPRGVEEGREPYDFKLAYLSPVPIPFNYGCMPFRKADDGMFADCVIVGHKMRQGDDGFYLIIGAVEFEDNGEKDTKYIASNDGKRHELRIHLFFKIYEKAKFFIGLLTGKGFTKSSYKGIRWY